MSRPDPNRSSTAVSTAAMIGFGICFLLSGTAALAYQIAWTRQFAILFGTTELALATVLAAYMGGLAFGAWLTERFLHRVARPVFAYAWLELGIGVAAVVVVPAAMWVADVALQALFGNQPAPPEGGAFGAAAFYLLAAFVALVLPTTLMGATLPMLTRRLVTDDSQIGRRVGMLYALNTTGAVLGALLTAFVLLPELGLTRTIWVAAGLNGFVFLLAGILARRVSPPPIPKGYSLGEDVLVPGSLAPPPPPPPPPPQRRPPARVFTKIPGTGWVLPLMCLAGAVAFVQEVLWTRLLAHVLGSGLHAFAVMVASFLAGIAIGGALGAALARQRQQAALLLGLAFIGAAVFAAGAFLLLGQQPRWNALYSGLPLLPLTICIGATYPLAVRVLARDADDAAPASARVYAWNTVGAVIGALAAGFVIVPALGFDGAIRLAVLASALLGIAAISMLTPPRTRGARIAAATVAALALAGVALFRPQPPMKLLVASPIDASAPGRVLHHDVGRNASVVMLAQGGGIALRTNGLPEALIDTPGALQSFSGEYWLAPLAILARPDARDLLMVGYGGGVALEAVPPSVQRVDVIEIEPAVIAANRAIEKLRKRNPLNDPRVNVIVNDARGALRLSTKQYDVIVSQPSHPWTAGASHLYTREFMRLAHDRLKPGGVYVQWMNVQFLDEDLMRSLTATMLGVFRELRVYRPDPATLVFIASDLPLAPERRMIDTGQPWRNAPLHYARYGINCFEDLVSALALDTEGARRLAFGARQITDDDNRLATSSVFARQRGMTADAAGRLLAGQDPLQNANSPVYGAWRGSLDFAYLARRNGVFALIDNSLADRVARMSQILGNDADGVYARLYYFRLLRQVARSNELLRLAIDEFPGAEALRLEYLRGWVPALAAGNAPPEVAALAEKLSPLPTAVLAAARHAVRREWRELAAADDALSRLPWTHPWYAEALELRVIWRLQLGSPETMRRFGDESLLLLDRLLVMNPTLSLFGLRARAGVASGRLDVMLESLSEYARLAKRMARAGTNAPGTQRQEAQSLLELLDSVAQEPQVDAARLAEVRAELEALRAN